MAWCESETEIDYVFGLAQNPRLIQLSQSIQHRASQEYSGKLKPIVDFFETLFSPSPDLKNDAAAFVDNSVWYCSLDYQTLDSWSRNRRVVAKVEYSYEEVDTLQETTVKNPQIRICTYMVAKNTSSCNGVYNIAVRIADNGSGIAETIRTRIFDPFFTTKDVGKGTGLGLAISYQIVVEKHGGTISCTSVPGEGTEFLIEIPLQKSFFAFDSNSAFTLKYS